MMIIIFQVQTWKYGHEVGLWNANKHMISPIKSSLNCVTLCIFFMSHFVSVVFYTED